MEHQTIYLEKCANCKSKNLVPEFGTSGQLVCQQCGMVGYTEQYSTEDIDELADMLKNVNTEDVPMEENIIVQKRGKGLENIYSYKQD